MKAAAELAQWVDFPTIQEVSDFVGMKFNTLNMSGTAHKTALKYGIREMRRIDSIGGMVC